ncbi:snake venom 5'-nucleotidase-like isoform X2 [Apostichopus japonicus]|uniref:snake venom 5'-nucleotidase-like isoform X2 n=1 Tax=Stichopus japonicus TaxID=307972 RepID=UPI003AB4F878
MGETFDRSNRFVRLVLLCIVCCSTFSQYVAALEVALLHTNDVHSRFEQTDKDGGDCTTEEATNNECYGGVARRMTKIKELRAENQNTILLDGGDQFLGSGWFYHYQGAAAAYFMNLLGYDAMALGNHEFDTGVQTLISFLNAVTFPVVSCNIDPRDEPGIQELFTKSTVIKVAGEKIGIVGYTYSRTPSISNPGKLIFEKEISAIQREVDKLTSGGIDKIIALGNSGYDMEVKIARETRGIDVIAGGNSFKFLYSGTPPTDDVVTGPYPTIVYPHDDHRSRDKVLLVQDPAYGKYLGFLKVTFDDEGRVTHYSGNPVVLDHTVEEDPETLSEINEWGEAVRQSSDAVVGDTLVHLDGGRESCRLRECNLGNVVTDAMLAAHVTSQGDDGWSDVTMAILNGGAIRSSINQGTIRNGDVTNVLPFMDTIDVVELNGHHLIEALEHAVESIDQVKLPGFFLQVSGLKIAYDLDNDPGRRVTSVEVLCGDCEIPEYEELQRGKLYKIVMTSYLARGGDGFKMIKDNIQNQKTGHLDSSVLSDYINKYSPITQGLEQRIKVTGEIPSSSTSLQSSLLLMMLIISLLTGLMA